MPNLRIMSDLHLEFADYEIPKMDSDKDSILILAGDINPWGNPQKYMPFWERASRQFKSVVYVQGNHEFYGTDLKYSEARAHLSNYPNVHLLDNSCIIIDGIKFIGTTLWTGYDNGDPVAMGMAYRLNDFRKIRYDGEQLIPEIIRKEHLLSLDFLDYELYEASKAQQRAVVITHHAPSVRSIHPKYRGDILNHCYYSDIEETLSVHQPLFHIHGHMHDAVEYTIGGTDVVCNPRGYHGYEKDTGFNPLLIKSIELND